MFPEIKYLTNKALYGYTNNSVQGYNSWYYLEGDLKNPKYLEFNRTSFSSKNCMIYNNIMSSKKTNCIRRFICNIEGNATIYGNFRMEKNSQSSANIEIYLNEKIIYSSILE